MCRRLAKQTDREIIAGEISKKAASFHFLHSLAQKKRTEKPRSANSHPLQKGVFCLILY